MQKLEFGMVKGKMWLYYAEPEGQPEMVEVKSIEHKTVTLSNGVRISTDSFYEVCEPAFDEQPVHAEEHGGGEDGLVDLDTSDYTGDNLGKLNKQPSGEYDPIKEMMSEMQFDEHGIPLPSPQHQQQAKTQLQTTQQQSRKEQPVIRATTIDSPLVALIEKAQMKDIELTFKLKVPAVPKVLFNAFLDAYPPEEIDLLFDYLINKVGIDNIKEAIKSKMSAHYKGGKKDATA